jgi:hypothetical protein
MRAPVALAVLPRLQHVHLVCRMLVKGVRLALDQATQYRLDLYRERTPV